MNRPIPLTVVQDSSESLYAAQPKIYPREIDGRFARLRIAAVLLLVPWVTAGPDAGQGRRRRNPLPVPERNNPPES